MLTLVTQLFKVVEKKRRDVDKELIPTLKKLYELEPSVAQWPAYVKVVQGCIDVLQKRVAAAKARKDDWSIVLTELTTSPHCSDCIPVCRDTTSTTNRPKVLT